MLLPLAVAIAGCDTGFPICRAGASDDDARLIDGQGNTEDHSNYDGTSDDDACLLDGQGSVEDYSNYDDALAALRAQPCAPPCYEYPGHYTLTGECDGKQILFLESGEAWYLVAGQDVRDQRHVWETRYYDAETGQFLALEHGGDAISPEDECWGTYYWPVNVECTERTVTEFLFLFLYPD